MTWVALWLGAYAAVVTTAHVIIGGKLRQRIEKLEVCIETSEWRIEKLEGLREEWNEAAEHMYRRIQNVKLGAREDIKMEMIRHLSDSPHDGGHGGHDGNRLG